jgi:hypothetical protein
MVMGSAAAEADYTTEEFAAETPAVPTERYECESCGDTVIGDPRKSDVCSRCRRERGLEVPEPLPDGCEL